MISVRGLHKRHGEHATLSGIDLEVDAGETVAILGPSGGGKSTLLRCLDALEPFDSGAIRIAGHELSPGPTPLTAAAAVRLRRAVGLVFQEHHLFPHLTVLDNLTLAPRVAGSVEAEAARATATALLDRVGLHAKAGAYPRELSGGQRQRVALARALAMAPEVLLLDEPTAALDRATAAEVAETIASLTGNQVTVVLVTHHPELAERLADRVLRLEQGRLHGADAGV